MAQVELHDTEKLVRYAEGALAADERAMVDEHIGGCPSCQGFVSFMQEFNANLRETKPAPRTSAEPCLDSELIIALDAGELDAVTAQHVRAHILSCASCMEEFFLLRSFARAEEAEKRAVSWKEWLPKLKEFVIDFGKTYGPGAMLGSIRIMAEGPALAVRGSASLQRIFKVIEMPVGENTYSIELSVASDGSVSCDVTGYRTPRETLLKIVVFAETGEELLEVETDKRGNTHFVLTNDQAPESLRVLSFTVDGDEAHLLFLVPTFRTQP
jgi:hypothetical protein